MTEYAELREEKAATPHNEQQPAEGEEIMVNTPYDVFILPLQPSGLSSGPRFVVHVPLIEAPAVKALQAEIEGLREQLRLSTVDQVNAEAEANDARAEIEALRAERDALAKDAERYRYIRDKRVVSFGESMDSCFFFALPSAPTFDAAIDAAMEGEK